VPVTVLPPTIAGKAKQGELLTGRLGRWWNGPTSYVHQWYRCNVAGRDCKAIPGATDETYLLAAADVGHTIRVHESASNIAGTSAQRSSRATELVRPRVPVAARGSLSGVSRDRPTLGLTVTAGPGEKPLETIMLTLPALLGTSGGGVASGLAVDVRGRGVGFSAKLAGRTLTITLRRPATGVRITLGDALITVTERVARRARAHKQGPVAVALTASEVGGRMTRLHPRVPVS
jgi:hypothetical protein